MIFFEDSVEMFIFAQIIGYDEQKNIDGLRMKKISLIS